MPRERSEPVRKGGHLNAEKFFILSFEGEKSEPKYFEDLRKSEYFNNSGLIETIPLKRPSKRGTNPIDVKKLLKEAKTEFNFKKTDEFWLIIDRDHWETIHNINFDNLVLDCKKEENFFLAMSNPCFEIWLIMHLKDLDDFTQDEKDKIFVNKKESAKKNHIDNVLGDLLGRGYNKRPNPQVFLPKLNDAILRAEEINSEEEDYPQYLGTKVHKLIEKLIN
ncbi:RloB family protein [Saccharicrinis aurantiacus]|uniref:RloB family protein n=1 Tax=Saccharicrinis aurantiacus TaxID=1849719 RepID=UPI00083836E6|nr:RloB family protein [Saccharicrinis aurantiacus]